MRRRDRGTYDDLKLAKIIEVFPRSDIASCLDPSHIGHHVESANWAGFYDRMGFWAMVGSGVF